MNNRNRQIDALRGISIIVIMFFHLFERYNQLYLPYDYIFLRPLGTFGNCVFLTISSYYMISRKPCCRNNNIRINIIEFLMRLLKLWPCYFISITLTFICVTCVALPGRTCSLSDYLFNISFINGFIGIPYVDSAHWYLTTLIAITFVTTVLVAVNIQHKKLTYIIIIIVNLILNYLGIVPLARIFGGNYTGLFCSVIAYKEYSQTHDYKWFGPGFMGLMYSFLIGGVSLGICAVIALIIFLIAQQEKMWFLDNSFIEFFGSISYCLYLLHQNISYSLIYNTTLCGMNIWLSRLIACAISILFASLLHLFVEKRWLDTFKKIERFASNRLYSKTPKGNVRKTSSGNSLDEKSSHETK